MSSRVNSDPCSSIQEIVNDSQEFERELNIGFDPEDVFDKIRYNNRLLYHYIGQLQAHMDLARKQIKENNDIIYRACDHEWIKDMKVISEHTEFICRKCKMDQR